MRKKAKVILKVSILTVLVLIIGGCWIFSRNKSKTLEFTSSMKKGEKFLSFDNYAKILKAFVDDSGMVNYRMLKKNRDNLDYFAAQLGVLKKSEFNKWTDPDKIALLINAYNAFTLEAIIVNYPIQSSMITSLRFPKNSIRQISGVWDELKFNFMGENITLDFIEHKMLRANFDEPRIHYSLVCAAKGCPALRNEPFSGKALEKQLSDQEKRFVRNREKFRINRKEGIVYLSSIWKWYGKDFRSKFATSDMFSGHNAIERSVLNSIIRYLPAEDQKYLKKEKYVIDYLDYDWSLNEQSYSKSY